MSLRHSPVVLPFAWSHRRRFQGKSSENQVKTKKIIKNQRNSMKIHQNPWFFEKIPQLFLNPKTEIKFSPWWNNLFFVLDFSPDKVWLCIFDFWHLRDQPRIWCSLCGSESRNMWNSKNIDKVFVSIKKNIAIWTPLFAFNRRFSALRAEIYIYEGL